MARTPSLTREAAEMAIGPRGSLSVSAENRGLVRKWFVTQGLPALFVGGLSMRELAAGYNDVSGDEFAKLERKFQEAKEGLDSDESEESPVDETPRPLKNGHDDASALVDMLRRMVGNSVDAHQVRDIVRKELADRPSAQLEIKIADRPVIKTDGPRHVCFAQALTILANNLPLYLVGPAGSGKTTLAKQLADALGLPFRMHSAVSSSYEYLGHRDIRGLYNSTAFRDSYQHGGVCLLDELDGGDASAPLVLNAALENGHCAFPDSPEPIVRHPDFRCIAAANTWGHGADRVYVGRTQLDGATLNRFCFVAMDYDETLERDLVPNAAWVRRVQALRKSARDQKARLIISPRASIKGAMLLAAGMLQSDVENCVIWQGCDVEMRRRIEQGAM